MATSLLYRNFDPGALGLAVDYHHRRCEKWAHIARTANRSPIEEHAMLEAPRVSETHRELLRRTVLERGLDGRKRYDEG
jgi:hypothetical protein